MIELEHSPLGGSGADRWTACAGSFLLHRALLEADELEVVESEFAKLGTAAHELGATCLIEEREPYEFVGREIAGYIVGNPDGIDPNAVAVYVAECARIHLRDGSGDIVLIEETLSHPEIHPLLKGTVDFGLASPKRGIFLRDYKNGEGVGVDAPGNKQLLYYGFLVVLTLPWALEPQARDLPVSLGIVQPNFYGIFEEPEVWTCTVGDVLDFGYNVLVPRMNQLTNTRDIDDSDFVSGLHCQFCPVMLECPRLQHAYVEFANGSEFLEMLDDKEIDRFYGMREDARRFMNELGKVVLARKIAGRPIESAKLVEKKQARVWKVGADAAIRKRFGDKGFTEPKPLSPAQIEKLSSDGKALALEYGYKPEADALTIAPLTDPRPEAKPRTNDVVFEGFQQSNEELGW